MAFLTFQNVSHFYFSTTSYTKALEDVTFSIDEGEFCSIIGPSGCGKSTILSIIARLLQHTEGSVEINGQSIVDVKTNVGYMLQEDCLFPWKTVWENIVLGPKMMELPIEKVKDRALKLLEDVQLSHTINMYPDELSGGMRQRIALVRTLMTDPDLLLFDEPFSALDYVTKLTLENLVHDLIQTYKKTVILVTHDVGEAISMSDRILLMEPSPGRIAKTFVVPEELRAEVPFFVRRHPKYQPFFDEIWNQLHAFSTESKRG